MYPIQKEARASACCYITATSPRDSLQLYAAVEGVEVDLPADVGHGKRAVGRYQLDVAILGNEDLVAHAPGRIVVAPRAVGPDLTAGGVHIDFGKSRRFSADSGGSSRRTF